MNVMLQRTWTRDAFLDWVGRQEGRYEFDGTGPVAMTGGTLRHNMIMQNLFSALRAALRGMAAQVFGPDVAVASALGTIRYPDALITTEPVDEEALLVVSPAVLFEVASPSSHRIDSILKVREYATVASVRRYVVIEQASIAVTIFERDGADQAWRASTLADAAEILALPELGAEIALTDIYAGVTFGTAGEPAAPPR